MSLPDSLLVALFCLSLVFVVLAVLCLLIKLFSFGLNAIVSSNKTKPNGAGHSSTSISRPSEESVSELKAEEEFSAGELKLKGVDERTAAMIMAIVSDESGIPLSELCFRTIRQVTGEKVSDNEISAGGSIMKYTVTINDKAYEVEVEKGQANIVKTTTLTAAPIQQVQTAEETAPKAPASAAAPLGGGKTINAPMPGVILDIKLAAGTTVKKGQIILILEAMKMENEIVAPEDGVITQVLVAKGASVATGDALVVMQ